MYINTYIVFCCCSCCETSRVSSSSLSVLATYPLPHLHPLSPFCSLSCCQPSSPRAYGEEKLLPGIFYVFRLLIFAILTCWVFLFPFLYFPFLCSALLGIALRSYLFPLPSARIMKTSSTKVVWVILLAASPVPLFGCLVKMKGISLLFFVTPCFSVFLHFVGYSIFG